MGFYRTAARAVIDRVLELGAVHGVWVIEIRRIASSGLQKGNHHALADNAPSRCFYVHGDNDRLPITPTTEAIGLPELATVTLQIWRRRAVGVDGFTGLGFLLPSASTRTLALLAPGFSWSIEFSQL